MALAIEVVLDRWVDHVPRDRQVRIYGRHGLVVTSQILWDLAYSVAQRLAVAQPVIGLDQTGWPRLDTGADGARRGDASYPG